MPLCLGQARRGYVSFLNFKLYLFPTTIPWSQVLSDYINDVSMNIHVTKKILLKES